MLISPVMRSTRNASQGLLIKQHRADFPHATVNRQLRLYLGKHLAVVPEFERMFSPLIFL
jgi:hypothetical protein